FPDTIELFCHVYAGLLGLKMFRIKPTTVLRQSGRSRTRTPKYTNKNSAEAVTRGHKRSSAWNHNVNLQTTSADKAPASHPTSWARLGSACQPTSLTINTSNAAAATVKAAARDKGIAINAILAV